ncbi:YolD-like family protein [Paenibacillus sp. J31TS4]|uniref:YolD-like family protein n=1 Tax=Paenibacillus sp. J31TS4 TaxID=2807195 RepID=UPI0020BFA793|nr:YolD-like family protein [Paenibacillus sp. J31TS4]
MLPEHVSEIRRHREDFLNKERPILDEHQVTLISSAIQASLIDWDEYYPYDFRGSWKAVRLLAVSIVLISSSAR